MFFDKLKPRIFFLVVLFWLLILGLFSLDRLVLLALVDLPIIFMVYCVTQLGSIYYWYNELQDPLGHINWDPPKYTSGYVRGSMVAFFLIAPILLIIYRFIPSMTTCAPKLDIVILIVFYLEILTGLMEVYIAEKHLGHAIEWKD